MPTSSIWSARSGHGRRTSSVWSARSGHGQRTSSVWSARSGTGRSISTWSARSGHGQRRSSTWSAISNQWPLQFAAYHGRATAARFLAPTVKIEAYLDGAPLKIKSYSLRRSRSELASWSIDLYDPDGTYAPGSGVPDTNPWDSSHGIRSSVTLVRTVGGQTRSTSSLLVQDYSYSETPQGNVIGLSGECAGAILYEEDQWMADVEHSSSNEVIKEILSTYGLQSSLETESFDVLMQHRVGQPIEWVRSLLEVTQGWWLVDGTTFKARVGGWRGAPDWVLQDRHHLKVLRFRRSARGEINEHTIQRVETLSAKAVVAREDQGMGYVDRQLEFPVDRGMVHVSVQDGDLQSVQWRNAKGFTIGTELYYGGVSGPATSIRLEIRPNTISSTGGTQIIQATAIEPRKFKWWVDAMKVPPVQAPAPSAYTATYADTAHQSATFPKRHREPETNELIPDYQTAYRCAKRKVGEQLRGYETASIEILLNPMIDPGHMVSITAEKSQLSGYLMLIDALEESGTENSATMTLELTRPRIPA